MIKAIKKSDKDKKNALNRQSSISSGGFRSQMRQNQTLYQSSQNQSREQFSTITDFVDHQTEEAKLEDSKDRTHLRTVEECDMSPERCHPKLILNDIDNTEFQSIQKRQNTRYRDPWKLNQKGLLSHQSSISEIVYHN